MKFSFSNLLAIASILVWASAWAATEKSAVSADAAAPAAAQHSLHVSFPKAPQVALQKN